MAKKLITIGRKLKWIQAVVWEEADPANLFDVETQVPVGTSMKEKERALLWAALNTVGFCMGKPENK